jgi:hypothetical protein
MALRGRKKGSKNTSNLVRWPVLLLKSQNPDWSAVRIRARLIRENPKERTKIPQKRTIYKILADGKTTLEIIARSGLERPWHLGIVVQKDEKGNIIHPEYSNLSSEALFEIGKLQVWCESKGIISVRQAAWITRLYRYKVLWEQGKVEKEDYYLRSLYAWSRAYSEYELICDLSVTPINTVELDKKLLSGEHPVNFVKLDDSIIITFAGKGRISTQTFSKDGKATTTINPKTGKPYPFGYITVEPPKESKEKESEK